MGYTVTPLRLDAHREMLARLWTENMSETRIGAVVPERMRWLYEQAPEGRTTTVLCLDSGSGEAVGCGSFYARTTWVKGQRVRAGVLCDFAVAAAHRVGGAALAIQRALVDEARKGGLELLFGHPNAKSVAVFKRVGYRVLGETTAWVKPLRAEPRLREVLPWTQAATFAAVPIDVALRVFDRARSMAAPLRVRGEAMPRPDGRVDTLWSRARAQYGVVGEQSPEYLEWRYARFTTAEHQLFGAFARADGHPVAFAVYGLNGAKAIVCDLFADHLEVSAESLLLALAEYLRPRGVESLSLSYIGAPGFGTQLQSVGFLPRPGRRPVVVYPLELDDAARARVMDPTSWFMLEGELDI